MGRQINFTVASSQPILDENIAPPPTKVRAQDLCNPVVESTATRLPDGLAIRGGNVKRVQTGQSLVGGQEVVSATVSSVIILMVPLYLAYEATA